LITFIYFLSAIISLLNTYKMNYEKYIALMLVGSWLSVCYIRLYTLNTTTLFGSEAHIRLMFCSCDFRCDNQTWALDLRIGQIVWKQGAFYTSLYTCALNTGKLLRQQKEKPTCTRNIWCYYTRDGGGLNKIQTLGETCAHF